MLCSFRSLPMDHLKQTNHNLSVIYFPCINIHSHIDLYLVFQGPIRA